MVTQVVGVVLYRLGCAGGAVGIGRAEGLQLVAIVVVGVVDAIGEGPVDAFLDRKQALIGVGKCLLLHWLINSYRARFNM